MILESLAWHGDHNRTKLERNTAMGMILVPVNEQNSTDIMRAAVYWYAGARARKRNCHCVLV